MTDSNLSISKTIRELRKLNKYTQSDLANELNVSRSSIAMWETDRANPTPDQLKQLAKKFNVSIDFIFGMEQPALDLISNRISVLMNEQNISRASLAEMSNTPIETINRICDKKLLGPPDPIMITNIAIALGTTFSYIMDGDINNKVPYEYANKTAYLNLVESLMKDGLPINDIYLAAKLVRQARNNNNDNNDN